MLLSLLGAAGAPHEVLDPGTAIAPLPKASPAPHGASKIFRVPHGASRFLLLSSKDRLCGGTAGPGPLHTVARGTCGTSSHWGCGLVPLKARSVSSLWHTGSFRFVLVANEARSVMALWRWRLVPFWPCGTQGPYRFGPVAHRAHSVSSLWHTGTLLVALSATGTDRCGLGCHKDRILSAPRWSAVVSQGERLAFGEQWGQFG